MMQRHILVADDEREIVSLLKLYLENAGFRVTEAYDGAEALAVLKKESVDLALIDIMMPRLDGYGFLRQAREVYNLPILILSAKSEVSDRILGLGMGADDYIAKPFDALEVVARVEANLRRFYRLGASPASEPKTYTVRDLSLDAEACVLYKGGSAIELTSIEYKILLLFMKSPGQVFTKKQIYETAWGDTYVADDNNIMVYISKLRDKLGEDGQTPYIRTIRGLGYKLIAKENGL